MINYLVEVSFSFGYQLTALFDIRSDLWHYQLWIDLAIPFYERLAELGGHQAPARLFYNHVISLDDIGDVSGNRSICSNSMLLHLGYELSLCKVARRFRSALSNSCGQDVNDITNFIERYFLVIMSLPRHYIQEPRICQNLALELEFLLANL